MEQLIVEKIKRDFGISPNLSSTNNNASSLVVRSNTVNNPPMRSHRRHPSPLNSHHQNLDASPSYDRQLFGAGAVRKLFHLQWAVRHQALVVMERIVVQVAVVCHVVQAQVNLVIVMVNKFPKNHKYGTFMGQYKLRSNSRKSMQIKILQTNAWSCAQKYPGQVFKLLIISVATQLLCIRKNAAPSAFLFVPLLRCGCWQVVILCTSGTTATGSSF
ncbi:hypothetical protein EVAR_72565_1 [Eumeta japonica]|uniref:Uncharacterized protein n=1 Tax=Eumeta variegata TaxID=151549 RepID=A0A4C1T674_EUMVA|nr:hypothetical protein EVAR_72565_1 [Eumeta japonica]